MKRIIGLFALLMIAGLASAQNRVVISPEAIVVNPNPDFDVEVFFDRGGDRPVYEVGASIRIGVRPTEDAYIYLFDIRPDGHVTQILPNRFDRDGENNFVRGGQTRYFPPQDARYSFTVEPPRGLSKVIAVASKEQLDTQQLAQFRSEEDFATSEIGEQGFARAFSIVVRPIQQSEWVTDTALYHVGERQGPQYATLRVETNPRGAEVYLDGDFIGFSPVEYGARPGRHDVRIELEGHDAVERSVNLRPGEQTRIDVSLQQTQRAAFVDFRSSPSGAEVYVDGNFVGTTPVDDVRVEPGRHEARFARSGYQSTSRTFSVSSGDEIRVDATLRATTGSIRVQANVGGAQVYLDGRSVGTIPSGSGTLTLDGISAGVHQLTVVAPGYTTYVTDVNVRSGETSTVNVRQSSL